MQHTNQQNTTLQQPIINQVDELINQITSHSRPDTQNIVSIINSNNANTLDDYTYLLVAKVILYQHQSNYLMVIVYGLLALWFSSANGANILDENKIEFIKQQISQAQAQYKNSLSATSEDSNLNTFTPEDPESLIDKVSGNPIDFNTISGMETEKNKLRMKFIYPNIYSDLFYDDKANILLYGPPGTGKTLLAKAIVGEINKDNTSVYYLLFNLSADGVRGRYEGDTEKNIEKIFSDAQRAADEKKKEPENANKKVKSLLFLDEIEALAKSRAEDGGSSERSVTTLLQQMDGLKSSSDVVVLAATNYPWSLDSAFLRRFTARIFVDLLDLYGRFDIIIDKLFRRFVKKDKHYLLYHLSTMTFICDDADDEFCQRFELWKQFFSADKDIHSQAKENIFRVDKAYNVVQYSEDNEKTIKDDSNIYINNYQLFMRNLGNMANKPYEQDQDDDFNFVQTSLTEIINKKIVKLNEIIDSVFQSPGGPAIEDLKTCIGEYFTTDNGKNFFIFCICLAEYTGPKLASVVSGAIGRRYATDSSITLFGYSGSDFDNVVREIYSQIAENIIRTNQFSDKIDNRECGKTIKHYHVEVGGNENFSNIYSEDNSIQDIRINNENGINMISEISISTLNRSLSSYPSTTGNNYEMCDFTLYDRQSVFDKNYKATKSKEINELLDENMNPTPP